MTPAPSQQAPKSIEELEDRLSLPTPGVVDVLSRLPGDLVILGAGGKMGPTLTRMAIRASELAGTARTVHAVSRFSEAALAHRLERGGATIHRADLTQADAWARLPDAPLVVAMTTLKFGASGRPADAWGVNTLMASQVAARYRDSRIVAFSTGNVYPLRPVVVGGARETDDPAPVGEYGMTCLGRERLYEYCTRESSAAVALVRLNYACELRYGVLVDIARRVLADEPLDLAMGAVNVIWQGDANARALQLFEHAANPPRIMNVTGPETLSVRAVAEEFARLLGRTPRFTGEESPSALLCNAARSFELFGYPTVPLGALMHWIADWLLRGGETWSKPTHFGVRDGRF